MRFMVIVKADKSSEAGVLPDKKLLTEMGKFNDDLVKAGVMLAGEGLADTDEGFVVDFSSEKPAVTDGPYGEVHELFNGFWIIQVSSKEEAVEWASRAPLGPGSKLEVRRVTEMDDFADFADNEYVKKEEGWRAELGTE